MTVMVTLEITLNYRIGITDEEAKENERSPSDAILCAGLSRKGMVSELEQVLQVCDGLLCSISVTYDGAVLLWQW